MLGAPVTPLKTILLIRGMPHTNFKGFFQAFRIWMQLDCVIWFNSIICFSDWMQCSITSDCTLSPSVSIADAYLRGQTRALSKTIRHNTCSCCSSKCSEMDEKRHKKTAQHIRQWLDMFLCESVTFGRTQCSQWKGWDVLSWLSL